MLVIVALMTGCATASKATDWLRGRDKAPTDDAVILGAPDAEEYLKELYELASGDPRKQADIFADAAAAAKLTPGPSSNLRFGMILATPGHSGTDPARAENVLRDVLARSELLTSTEMSLATIYLNSVTRLNTISAEARRSDGVHLARRARRGTRHQAANRLYARRKTSGYGANWPTQNKSSRRSPRSNARFVTRSSAPLAGHDITL